MTGNARASRIAETFVRLRADGEKALMPYVTVGHPRKGSTLEVVPELVAAGASMLELGIPFSDPLADGPTIQRSSFQALENGVNVSYCLETVSELRSRGIDVPLILMGYFNPILRYGLEQFVAACAGAGVDGLIVPDLPPEESAELAELCRQRQRDLIFMVAPTSTDEHIRRVADQASGFVYCVALTGVTGARDSISASLPEFLKRVRKFVDLPIAVGFGISTPEHVRDAGEHADGVIVGSALVSKLNDASKGDEGRVAGDFLRYLRGA